VVAAFSFTHIYHTNEILITEIGDMFSDNATCRVVNLEISCEKFLEILIFTEIC